MNTEGASIRLLVCGGRSYSDVATVFEVLDAFRELRPIEAVIHGAARGADTLADLWARSRRIPSLPFHAEWYRLGKQAGRARNLRMLDEGMPNFVMAFPGGAGTQMMTRLAQERGLLVYTVKVNTGSSASTGYKSSTPLTRL